ncbi:MAG: type 4a pilus biogenesis protein PilO [Deltaproteobacteria bacterium]|nr:type 4a pilus biogenesis protein PilO [Deltaproteobacteria bacterium]
MDFIETILRLKSATKVLILLLILGGVVVLYWQFFYRPVIKEVRSLEPELARLKAELSTKKAIIKEKPRYEAELEETRHKLIIALKQLPDKSEIPSLLENISALGKASGLEFILFRPQNEVSKNFYAEIPVDIKVKGSYKDTVAFFDKVSKMPRIVNMSNIAMSSPKRGPGEDMILAISCNATTYKFIEKAGTQ